MSEESINRVSWPGSFEVRTQYTFLRPTGVLSLPRVISLISGGIILARDAGVSRLLVDGTGLSGFRNPSLPERYWLAREWAMASQNRLACAFIFPTYLIEPERFGVIVATNMGMRVDVFDRLEPAVEWLVSDRPSSVLPDYIQRQLKEPHEPYARDGNRGGTKKKADRQ